jgi:hypothetical protein
MDVRMMRPDDYRFTTVQPWSRLARDESSVSEESVQVGYAHRTSSSPSSPAYFRISFRRREVQAHSFPITTPTVGRMIGCVDICLTYAVIDKDRCRWADGAVVFVTRDHDEVAMWPAGSDIDAF